MTKEIPLSQGKFALVDDDDYEWLNQWKWYCSYGYAVRNVTVSSGKQRPQRMHRLILGTPPGMATDHINHNRLDNRRANIRICTYAENMRNYIKPANNTSGYKGVSWCKASEKWKAQIKVAGKKIGIGYFRDPIDAARAYDDAARKHHGEFARVNFE